jgi:hypothetical protein
MGVANPAILSNVPTLVKTSRLGDDLSVLELKVISGAPRGKNSTGRRLGCQKDFVDDGN